MPSWADIDLQTKVVVRLSHSSPVDGLGLAGSQEAIIGCNHFDRSAIRVICIVTCLLCDVLPAYYWAVIECQYLSSVVSLICLLLLEPSSSKACPHA